MWYAGGVKVQQQSFTTKQVNREAATPTLPSGTLRQPASAHPVHQIQSALGNRAFGQLVQAKLQISSPGDEYEQEADRVADQVMRTPDAALAEPVAGDALPLISRLQRKCEQCEEEEVQRQPMEEEEEEGTLQAKEASGQTPEVTPGVPAQINTLRSGGQPLSESARAFFEPRFGYDFSQVRVYADSQADELAKGVNALAYTVGRDVVFGAGQYNWETMAGKKLLAHELAHVVQQGATSSDVLQRKVTIGELPPLTEVDFDALADQVFNAIEGLGTDEEAVYSALQQLRRDPGAISTLIQRYAQRHKGADMIADIYDDFSGTELEYALQLLGLGHAGAAQEITAPPEATTNLERAAQLIRDAVEGPGTDEEAIYATLLPFNRATQNLEQTYQIKFGESLRERILDEMSGSELDYALSLLSFNAEFF